MKFVWLVTIDVPKGGSLGVRGCAWYESLSKVFNERQRIKSRIRTLCGAPATEVLPASDLTSQTRMFTKRSGPPQFRRGLGP